VRCKRIIALAVIGRSNRSSAPAIGERNPLPHAVRWSRHAVAPVASHLSHGHHRRRAHDHWQPVVVRHAPLHHHAVREPGAARAHPHRIPDIVMNAARSCPCYVSVWAPCHGGSVGVSRISPFPHHISGCCGETATTTRGVSAMCHSRPSCRPRLVILPVSVRYSSRPKMRALSEQRRGFFLRPPLY